VLGGGALWWSMSPSDTPIAEEDESSALAALPVDADTQRPGTRSALELSNAVLRSGGEHATIGAHPNAGSAMGMGGAQQRPAPAADPTADPTADPAADPTTVPGSLRSLVADDRARGEAQGGPALVTGGVRAGSAPVAPSSPARLDRETLGGDGGQPPSGAGARNANSNATPNAQPNTPTNTPTSDQRRDTPAAPPVVGAPPTAPIAPIGAPAVQQQPVLTSNADLAKAFQLQASDPIQARALVTRLLAGTTLAAQDRERAYDLVNALSKQLLFNTAINPNDPTIAVYTVQPGDSLAKIVRSQKLACEALLLQRLNGIVDPRRIQVGQRLRVPRGAFHAEVVKSEYRLNLFLETGASSSSDPNGGRVMVASFRVGLGEANGTPTGLFRVRPKSKLIDPEWTHPKTGEYFAANDPKNPIGEHWIGIMGVEESNKNFLGYGIHGTIEPDSIGHDRSLGCVRLLAPDVAFVYECLVEPSSTIVIR
jgi:LysM repeat protein